MMAKYKTEKRKANVGERILITNAAEVLDQTYVDGDVFTVIGNYGTCKGDVIVRGQNHFVDPREYEVIIAEYPPKQSKNERISLLESQVADLTAKVEALEKRRKPAVALTQTPTIHNITVNLGESTAKTAEQLSELFRKFAEEQSKKPTYTLSEIRAEMSAKRSRPTPNEQRKVVIERAKAFVARYSEGIIRDKSLPTVRQAGPIKVELHVNAKKRIVTAVVKWAHMSGVRDTVFAKCAPDDVFNADIGKAIALGRALGLDVSEFENAVKPTEVVVGHTVRSLVYDDKPYYVTEIIEGKALIDNTKMFYGVSRIDIAFRITDDTEAQY